LYVPASYDPLHPKPLVVALHGAGITADGPINLLSVYAEESGFLLLAPESQSSTWDAIYRPFGPDLETVDALLRYAFDHCAVDPSRVVLEGFSDGASYALAVGLANGDLFTRIIAFSPGFIPTSSSPPAGRPEFFFSHGRQDPVLPIDGSSRIIVPSLQRAGYDVTYVEFDGQHTVPVSIIQQAVAWLTR
jgi:predicted esterase